jgi:nicotinate-nucleotide pyrophosphorylase (carboxylating)
VHSDAVAIIEGSAKQIALAEEQFLGWIAKASGIATAAGKARTACGNQIKAVSGAWKKMPPPIKELVRQAILDGGLQNRISEPPFIYLDKNYVKILGGVEKTLRAEGRQNGMTLVVQLKSQGQTLLMESLLAANMGADIIMIDTGRKEDIEEVDFILRRERLRHQVKVAFGGNIKIEDLEDLRKKPVEIVDIGRAIVDAPLLDMRLDVLEQ